MAHSRRTVFSLSTYPLPLVNRSGIINNKEGINDTSTEEIMKKITILALRGAAASSITGPMDAFLFAGVLWNIACGQKPSPCFEITVASPDGHAVKCANRLYIEPHCGIRDVKKTDLIMIPGIAGEVERIIGRNKEVVDWLIRQYRSGAHIASICTGAFILAETRLQAEIYIYLWLRSFAICTRPSSREASLLKSRVSILSVSL